MTTPTPRSLCHDPSFLHPSSDYEGTTSRFAPVPGIDQAIVHLNSLALGGEQRPPALPSPFDGDDIPAELSLPVLEPRASKQRRRELDETSATLLNFVSHMTLNDLRSSLSAPSFSRSHFADLSSPPVRPSDDVSSLKSGRVNGFDFDHEEVTTVRALGTTQPPTTSWSLTTPETTKVTISTPRACRLGSQKRKSPIQQVHFTPVDGNRPLMIPSLNTTSGRMNVSSCTSQNNCQRHLLQQACKKAKSYKTLISSAPMLPASPDLEDRQRAAGPRFQFHAAPCFSPMGGVTLVNPSFLRHVVSTSTTPVATPQQVPRRTVVPSSTTGLPSLDEEERSSAPKWLRMKRRESLISALRLAATES